MKRLLFIAVLILVLSVGCIVKPPEPAYTYLDNILVVINEQAKPLPGFQPDVLKYNYILDNDGVPDLIAVTRNETDIVNISYPPAIPGAAAISVRPKVTTGDTYVTTIYIILFSN